MTDTTEVIRWRPVHGGYVWVRATDYDALAARLADVTDDCDDLQIALASTRKQLKRYIGEAEAALPAVYRLALGDAEQVVEEHYKEVKPHDPDDRCPADLVSHGYGNACFNIGFTLNITTTPAAEELMARIQTGEE